MFKLPALWIERELRQEAGFRGLTVVDCGTVVTTHLTEIVKDNIADLLSYAETQKLLDEVHKESAKLIADIVPSRISISGVQRILQNLLAEGVSIRDLPTILEGVAEASAITANLTQVTEHVRARLARQISAQHTLNGTIPIVALGLVWDEAFSEAIIGQGDDRHLAMAPSQLQGFIAAVRETYDRLAAQGEILPADQPQPEAVRALHHRARSSRHDCALAKRDPSACTAAQPGRDRMKMMRCNRSGRAPSMMRSDGTHPVSFSCIDGRSHRADAGVRIGSRGPAGRALRGRAGGGERRGMPGGAVAVSPLPGVAEAPQRTAARDEGCPGHPFQAHC
ncbi:FHIPEP family type III secretion protein [Novosphingobium panipatense]